jgi:hypothetical protein
MPSLSLHSPVTEIELTDEQRRQVIERAEAAFHRDWFPWPPLIVHGVSIAIFLLAWVLLAYWLDRASLLPVLPALLMSLPLAHVRPFRLASAASTWRFSIYFAVAMLSLAVVAIYVGWQALLINVGAMAMAIMVLNVWARRAMEPYMLIALSQTGAGGETSTDQCTACGYALDGLPRTTIRCPECGEVRLFPRDSRLGLASREPLASRSPTTPATDHAND